jgi:glycosyltransferase involved in cell wall biosynthesis
MIPTYNRTEHLERALSSVLSQDPGNEEMQIEVVDNASDVDDPEPLVRRLGGDRVSFARQPRNIGAIGNWNSCIERSRGEWVHILHSDDVVFPGFYARLKTGLERMDQVGAAFCRHVTIDGSERQLQVSDLERPTPGILPALIEKIGVSSMIQCASIVVRRSVYEKLGGFRPDLPYAADWEMWKRISAQYPVWYEPEILAAWRLHPRSYSTAMMRSAGNVIDALQCIEISYSLLPPDRADAISRKAREWVFRVALNGAADCLGAGDLKGALNQFREGLKCALSLPLTKALLVLPLRVARGGMRRAYAAGKRQFARGKS